jgi:hydroxyacylglutathione hydrolase
MAFSDFQAQEILPNTWRITTPGCDCYLLNGADEAILIDSGMSSQDIRAFAQSLTPLPLSRVINTHSHFDHTAGNGFFDTVYGTEGIARSAKNTMGCDPEAYRLDYSFTIVKDNNTIPLNGRPLRILVLDCHAPGNLAILDETNRILFPGDEIETGQVLLLPGYAEEPGQIHAKSASTVETYLHAMQKLQKFSGYFDTICPAHNGSPIGKEWLEKYIVLAQMILDGLEGKTDCSSPSYNASANHFPRPDANYLRAEHDGASLIYCGDLIFDTDYPKAAHLKPATDLHILCRDFARQ